MRASVDHRGSEDTEGINLVMQRESMKTTRLLLVLALTACPIQRFEVSTTEARRTQRTIFRLANADNQGSITIHIFFSVFSTPLWSKATNAC